MTMQAVFTSGSRGRVELRETEIPEPRAGEALVKVIAAAQNPSDCEHSNFHFLCEAQRVLSSGKTIYHYNQEGNIVGCDFAGIVTQLPGAEFDGIDVKVGDRVAGAIQGCELLSWTSNLSILTFASAVRKNGAFAEYVVAPAGNLIKIPDNWTFEQAAQLGIACFTACQCLYQSQSLPSPSSPTPEPLDLLVWSGTSSVGHYTIQLAKLAGMRVITTASPKHFDWVKSLGAELVFDYKDTKAGQKIRVATQGNLKHAVDCISEKTAPFQVSDALSLSGGTVSVLLPYESRKKGVKTVYSLAYTMFSQVCPSGCNHYPDR